MSDSLSTLNPVPAGPHPSVDTWVDYYAKKVPGKEAESLRKHLSRCRQCLDLVLDLDLFVEPAPPPANAVASFEQAAVWRTVKSAVAPRSSARIRQWQWPAIAASLCCAALGMTAWTQQQNTLNELRTRVEASSQLQPNVPIVDLRPGATQRSSGGVDPTVDLPAAAGITLVLHLEDEVDYPDYELRIVDQAEAEIDRISGLLISEFGNFRLGLPPGALAVGEYEFQLFGLGGGGEHLIETYLIRQR